MSSQCLDPRRLILAMMLSLLPVALPAGVAAAAVAEPVTKPSLPAGTPVVPADVESFRFGGGSRATREVVAVEGQPFARAVRVRTTARPPQPWDVQFNARTTAPVRKGDALLMTFWLRTVDGGEEGRGVARAIFERAGPPHEKSLATACEAGPAWERFQLPFAAEDDYPAGGASVNFHLGADPQTVEVGGVSVVNYGAGVRLADLPRTSVNYAGREPDAAWRKEAAERIERVRKGELTVVVTDASGKPVEGATVEVRMRRHAFPFGSAVAGDLLIKDSPDAERYRQHVASLFNRVVMENDLKWPSWERGRKPAVEGVRWLRDREIEVRGHNLVWPSWRYSPKRLQELKGDPAALRKAVADHIADVAGAMRGQLVEWDVVNEPFDNHDVTDVLGGAGNQEALVEWFKLARAADPNAKLFINDYPPLIALPPPGSGRVPDPHLAHYARTIRFLLDRGAPLDGIGFQCHYGGSFTAPRKVLAGLDHFAAAFGKPIAITEFDFDTSDEALQADVVRDMLTLAFSHPAVDQVIMWGFWEGRHWRPQAAMFRKDWTPKPAAGAWRDLVRRQWWTNADGRTDAAGTLRTRGFLGAYDVTVRRGERAVGTRVTLGKDGTNATVKLD